MAKFRIESSATAVVSQSIEIEADNADEARAKYLAGEYNDHVWDYRGVNDETVDVESVSEAN
jgi:hypothetical protein